MVGSNKERCYKNIDLSILKITHYGKSNANFGINKIFYRNDYS